MPRGSAPIVPCGSAFRICLLHRQIHGSRRRARARIFLPQYCCPHKKVSFGWPFCVGEGTLGATHPKSYMPRGSAPIIPRGSAFRICLFHRQIHGSRRRAGARVRGGIFFADFLIFLLREMTTKIMRVPYRVRVPYSRPISLFIIYQHFYKYKRNKTLHQNCKNNAILVQYWFCILPDA